MASRKPTSGRSLGPRRIGALRGGLVDRGERKSDPPRGRRDVGSRRARGGDVRRGGPLRRDGVVGRAGPDPAVALARLGHGRRGLRGRRRRGDPAPRAVTQGQVQCRSVSGQAIGTNGFSAGRCAFMPRLCLDSFHLLMDYQREAIAKARLLPPALLERRLPTRTKPHRTRTPLADIC